MKRIDKRLKKQLEQGVPRIPAKTGIVFDETLSQIKEKQIRKKQWFSVYIVLVSAAVSIILFLNLKTGLWDEEKNGIVIDTQNLLTDAQAGKIIEEPQIEEIESIRVGMIDYRNPEIKRYTDMILAQFEKDCEENQKSSEADCEVLANTQRWFVLCLVVQKEEGEAACYYYNVDKQICQIVELHDLFVPEFDYVEVFGENIRKQLKEMLKLELREQEGTASDMEGYFPKVNKNQKFYFNQKGNLVLVFAKEEAVPEEMGYLKFVIEREVFERALK